MAAVSKHGCKLSARRHPSRRALLGAPQDEVQKVRSDYSTALAVRRLSNSDER
jgi:hypothetical protein